MTIVGRRPAARAPIPAVNEPEGLGGYAPGGRVAVDGKFLSRHGGRLRIHGVTYGPFAPDAAGQQFPGAERIREDFASMRDAGVNAVRTYHVPPDRLLDEARAQGLVIMVDVPWPKHLCFLDSPKFQAEAREAVRDAAERGGDAVLAYSVGNEIPPDVVRWHGARRVERFLAELRDVVKQADPGALVTYANFPPTEYLELPFLDFATFNVYLHDRETFRRYLFRLQNLVGERPLVLGELGMDTLRHGEHEQAEFLTSHVAEARTMGLAGSFVFSWTDDWFTGGHRVTDWAFGVTDAGRRPKPSYHALRQAYSASPAELAGRMPRASVVVCSYNGGRTLEQCLRSLLALDYPDYEVVLVDDGSTDGTREIAARFPSVRAIHQPNLGLSEARNVGLRASSGEVIAYTDSDCFADPDWLTLLVHQLQRSGAAAVGGPNLTPEDGWLAACVAASPGQPTHVLVSDQVAEHIPGCNMAFRREALETIRGFDPVYRKAGDDVDVCWRLQAEGYWITFAPGAFVWHHRRQGPRAYLRQQAGYGEAEALLRFKHPERFNGRGEGKWRGMMYGGCLRGLHLGGAMIYRGVFGTGLFQCVYQPGPAHWATLPLTLEWHGITLLALASGFFWGPAWATAAAMGVSSAAVAVLLAAQARLPEPFDGILSRLVVTGLSLAQPVVRSWWRYRVRLLKGQAATRRLPAPETTPGLRDLAPVVRSEYWGEWGAERVELVRGLMAGLDERRCGKVIDSGWSDWDLEIPCDAFSRIQVCTAQEECGGGRRLIRLRYTRVPSPLGAACMVAALGTVAAAAAVRPVLAAVALAAASAAFAYAWARGAGLLARVSALADGVAAAQGLLRIRPGEAGATEGRSEAPSSGQEPESRGLEGWRGAVALNPEPLS